MKYIIVDLEATCWEERKGENEIIEIGAVMVDESGAIISELEQFVKPKLNPVLSDFCTELTSITQEQVDSAPSFPEAVKLFQDWIGVGKDDYLLCSWGFYDRAQFVHDCKLHGIGQEWLSKHISIKHQHASLKGKAKGFGMKQALEEEGFVLDGTHHRGIDDARNIAKIFLKYFGEWKH